MAGKMSTVWSAAMLSFIYITIQPHSTLQWLQYEKQFSNILVTEQLKLQDTHLYSTAQSQKMTALHSQYKNHLMYQFNQQADECAAKMHFHRSIYAMRSLSIEDTSCDHQVTGTLVPVHFGICPLLPPLLTQSTAFSLSIHNTRPTNHKDEAEP